MNCKTSIGTMLILLSAGGDGFINVYSFNSIKQKVMRGDTDLINYSARISGMKKRDAKEKEGKEGRESKNLHIMIISVNPTNEMIAAGCENGEVFLWKLCIRRNKKISKTDQKTIEYLLCSKIPAHKKECLLLEWSINNILLSGSPDGKAKLWTLNSNDDLELKQELDMRKTLVAGSARCCSIAWSCNCKYAIASISGRVKSSEVSKTQSYMVAWNSFSEEAVVLGDKYEILGFTFTLCPHPTNDEIVLMGAGFGQLLLWNIENKSVIKEFWETGAYVYDPFREVDVFDGCFVPNSNDFVVVTSCGTVSFYGTRSSEPFSLVPVEQFRKCDYAHLFNTTQDSTMLCNVNLIQYEFPPTTSSYVDDPTVISNELYKVLHRIRKHKCLNEQQVYDYLEQDAISFIKIQLAEDNMADDELQVMENRRQENGIVENANLQEYHRQRQSMVNDLRRQRAQNNENDAQENEEKDEDENDSSESDYKEEVSKTPSWEGSDSDEEIKENVKPKGKCRKMVKEKEQEEQTDIYYIEEREEHIKACCKLCKRESYANIISLVKNSDRSIHINVHYDCLIKNDNIIVNKKRIENIDKCAEDLITLDEKCKYCKLLYPTVACSLCGDKFHGFCCADFIGGYYNNKYQCIDCTNSNNQLLYTQIIQSNIEIDIERLKRIANKQWIIDSSDINTIPQLNEKVYYLYEGHMKFLSTFSIISAYGDPIKRPWLQIPVLTSPTKCTVVAIDYRYPADQSLVLYEHFKLTTFILMVLTLEIDEDGQKFEVILIPNDCPDFLVSSTVFENAMSALSNNRIRVSSEYELKTQSSEKIKIMSIKNTDYQWESIEVCYSDIPTEIAFKINAWELNIKESVSSVIENMLNKVVISSVESYCQENIHVDSEYKLELTDAIYCPKYADILNRILAGFYRTEQQLDFDCQIFNEQCTKCRDKKVKTLKQHMANIIKIIHNDIPKRSLRSKSSRSTRNDALISVQNGIIIIDTSKLK